MYRLRLLGPVEVEREGAPVGRFVSRKAVAMLGYLAARGQPVSRIHLADLFWQDKAESRGRGNLSRAFNNLTTLLPGCWRADYHTIHFIPSAAYWLDIRAFEAGAAQDDMAALARAVELYRGDFMRDINLDDCPDFSAWLETERTRWRQRAGHLFHKLIQHHLYHREYEQGVRFASRWLELDPWQEEAHQQMMLLLARSDQRSAALVQYEACRRILAEEVGAEPAAETTALYQRIRAVESTPRPDLPAQPSPLIGREIELGRIVTLLIEPTCRMLTLVGPGGMGKTRLAIEAAQQLAKDKIIFFLHGIFFVPLEAVSSVDLIPVKIAEALHLSFYGAKDPKLHLLAALKDKELLLVLDNFEHLLEGADLLVDILQQAPGVKLLITSRVRLPLRWEWLLEITGLDLPQTVLKAATTPTQPGIEIEKFSAVRLFLQTARRVRLSFALTEANKPFVARICHLVEGMPLGIELAATWVQARSCEVIAQEIERNLDFLAASLRDLPPRHRSIRAVFDYSWGFLSEAERNVFSRLAVFRGGFLLDAAEQVAGATPAILTSLVSKSFLRRDASGRYDMHELLRQYGLEKLQESTEAYETTHDYHCTYYAEFVRQRTPTGGGNQKEMWIEINVEIDNIRAGWRWMVEQGRVEETKKAAEGLMTLYEIRGWFQEGEMVFGQAAMIWTHRVGAPTTLNTDIASQQAQHYVLGQLLNRQGWFCWRLNLHEKACSKLEQALFFLRQAGHDAQREISFALEQLGGIAWNIGDYEQAKSFLLESLAISQSLGDFWLMQTSLQFLGFIAQAAGKHTEAQQLYQKDYEICQQINDQYGRSLALICLGYATYAMGDYTQARIFLKNGLLMATEMEYRFAVGFALHHQGVLAYLTQAYEEAKLSLQESYKIFEETGERRFVALSLTYLGYVNYALEDYQAAWSQLYSALKLAHEAQAKAVILAALTCLAALLTQEDQPERALELLTLVLHHPASEQETKDRAERLYSKLKSQLPLAIANAAEQRGRTEKLEKVVAELLGTI
jgi:predicted ATPase/DNA-binding SARP family transcriptional activator